MAVFFLGLEIKREVLEGELSSRQISVARFGGFGWHGGARHDYVLINRELPENLADGPFRRQPISPSPSAFWRWWATGCRSASRYSWWRWPF